MLNPNGGDIYSAGLIEFANLIYDIVVTKSPKGRNVSKLWEKAYKIIPILQSLQVVDNLEEESANALYACLVELAEINDPITYPSLVAPAPIILNAGPPGADGDQGEKGDTGGGFSFNAGIISSTSPVNSFNVSLAYAARWDYIVNGTAQRAGTIIATWLEDGSAIDWSDTSTPDVNGSTSGIEFSVTFAGGFITLNAVITSGIWAISGTRYLIPESGTFVSIASTLSNGRLFIGNTSNQPQERDISGVVIVSDTGVTSFTPGVIVNADISNSANIAVSKLATLGNDKVVITNGSGVLVAHSTTTPTEVGHLAGVLSPIQTQINNKQDTITGAASTITSSNLALDFVLISHPATGKVVVSGITGAELNALSGIDSNIQDQLDNKVDAGTGATVPIVAEIGDWNMDSTPTVTVTLVGLTAANIRSITATVRTDSGSILGEVYYPVAAYVPANSPSTIEPPIGIGGWFPNGSDTQVILVRVDSSIFDSVSFNATGYNRGWIVITYET